MAKLKLMLLGGFELRDGAGLLINIGPKKAKALLAYLASAPDQRHTRDKLAALLWEESAETQARLSLRSALVSLRKALPDANTMLLTDTDTVAVVGTAIQVDVDTFIQLTKEATPEAWEQAVALYQGEFLEGINPRCFAFEDWLMERRHYLREQALQTAVKLLNHWYASQAFEPATVLAMRVLALDPLRESVQRMLMTLYARQGRYGAALKQYRLCRTVLRRELGITPEPETERVYREILVQRREQPTPDSIANVISDSTPATRITAHTSSSGFVGRQNERRQFISACEACLESGCGQAFLIRGEAGIGKSRLLAELKTTAIGLGFDCREMVILDLGIAAGEYAIRDLVRELLAIAVVDADHAEQAAQSLLGTSFSAIEQALLNDLLNIAQPSALRIIDDAMDSHVRHQGRQQLLQRLLTALSERRPLVLVVEDIHWATAATLSYLAQLADTVNHCLALLLMSSRTEGEPLDPAWRGAMHGAPLTTLDLGPLRLAEAKLLAEQLGATNNAFSAHCIQRADGNPLFLEQLLHAGRNTDGAIPDSIQSIVQARLQKLPPPERTAAQAAAVLGQHCTLTALRQLLDDPDYRADALISQSLLRLSRDGYAFTHALIRDGIYATLTPVTQRRLHSKAAAWFRRRDAVLYAEHLERIQAPEAAAAYLTAASARAKSYHYRRALELCERGLALTQNAAARVEFIRMQGELLFAIGSVTEAKQRFSQALDLATTDTQRCQAWIGLADCHNSRDCFTEVLELLTKAEQVAVAASHSELAQIDILRGNTFFTLGRIDDCLHAHERALSHARETKSPALEARSLSGLGDAYYQQGRMRTCNRYYEDCIALCDQHSLGRIKVANLSAFAISQFYQLELAAAVKGCKAAVALAKQVHNRRAEMVALDTLSSMLYYTTDFADAEVCAQQALELSRQLGSRMFESSQLLLLALARAALGHRREAEALLKEAATLSRETTPGFVGPWALATLALVTTDIDTRDAALNEGEALLQQGCLSHSHLHFYQLAIETMLTARDWSRAEHYIEALVRYTAQEPLPWSDFFIARGRLLAAHARDQRDDKTLSGLRQLSDQAQRCGLGIALPALATALTSD